MLTAATTWVGLIQRAVDIFDLDEWHRFDDDEVTTVKIEDILALRGGGDWHMAYYLIYRKLVTDL